jgi:ubiquinone/menaquinone biosynthesis C-methylase UbiE
MEINEIASLALAMTIWSMKPETAERILNKVKADYSRIAPDFSRTRQKYWEEMRGFAARLKSGDQVLDLGCGNGRLYEVLQDLSISYLGVDNSRELIDFAKRRWNENEKRRFLVGDATNLKWWRGEKYNAVFMIAVLHHIPSRELRKKVLENVAQILEKGGLLIMTNWNLFGGKYPVYILKNILKKIAGKSSLDFMDALIPWKNAATGEVEALRYVHVFTLRELRRLVKEAGLEIVENFYSLGGEKVHGWNGKNIVTIAKK